MNPIFAAALEVQDLSRGEGWPFCFIGALTVARWGEPRLTQDVDAMMFTGFGGEESVVSALLERLEGRLPDARGFALRNRVVLLQSKLGVPIDVSLGAIPFEQRVIGRASPWEIEPGIHLVTCGAEDLIVLKAFAAREKDWLDIEGVLLRQSGRLDEELVWRELEPLLDLKQDLAAKRRLVGLIEKTRP